MSVNEKMTAIADAIREKTGGTDALTLDGMAEAIPEVYNAGASSKKVFVGSKKGDGTQSISFEIPFVPDRIAISNYTARAIGYSGIPKPTNTVINYFVDFRSFSMSAGYAIGTLASSSSNILNIILSQKSEWMSYNNGVFTAKIKSGNASNFSSEGIYKIVADKQEASDEELLAQEFEALSGSATVTFNNARVSDVGEEVWNRLVATKPNITFVLA